MGFYETSRLVLRQCLLVSLLWQVASARFVNFEPGFEYIYDINSSMTLKDVQNFVVNGKIGLININEEDDDQELLLSVHRIQFRTVDQSYMPKYKMDFSKWFSFVISRRGEISTVYHDPDEDNVLIVKKGLAAMMGSKLHQQDEVDHELDGQNAWKYTTNEHGREGIHNSTYTVEKMDHGYKYTKERDHVNSTKWNGKSAYKKVLEYHTDINTIHSVMIEERVDIDFTSRDGFNPFYGMRPVKSVSEFHNIDFRQITAHTKDIIKFVEKKRSDVISHKPDFAMNGSIQHYIQKETFNTQKELQEAKLYITGNLTCIQRQPKRGTPKLSDCFSALVWTMERLHKLDLRTIVNTYLSRQNKRGSYSLFWVKSTDMEKLRPRQPTLVYNCLV